MLTIPPSKSIFSRDDLVEMVESIDHAAILGYVSQHGVTNVSPYAGGIMMDRYRKEILRAADLLAYRRGEAVRA